MVTRSRVQSEFEVVCAQFNIRDPMRQTVGGNRLCRRAATLDRQIVELTTGDRLLSTFALL
jgi:hypothetical protein